MVDESNKSTNKQINMKKQLLLAMALLYVGLASAQINTVVVNASGDVTLRQGSTFAVDSEYANDWNTVDSVLYLKGSGDFTVTMETLNNLDHNGSGDVFTEGTLNGNDLSVYCNGSGDVKLTIDYDQVYVVLTGSGDLTLRGRCRELVADKDGSGDLNVKRLDVEYQDIVTDDSRMVLIPNLSGLSELLEELGVNLERLSDSVDWENFEQDMERWGEGMEEWGRHMEEWGRGVEKQMEGRPDRKPRSEHWGKGIPDVEPQPDIRPDRAPADRPKAKSLLFDPHWGGVDAGLNMIFGSDLSTTFGGQYASFELKPLKSWNFNFNIADVGIAFSRSHVVGLYTGIGLGWNNYSLNQPVRLAKGAEHLEVLPINENQEGPVKKSKLGVLYVQAPLMLEVRSTRGFFIAAGVTARLRVNTWTKVKFMNKSKEKYHSDYYVNPLKLDATLRAGGKDMGFYASYDLLPLFRQGQGPAGHTFNVGFSLLF